MVIYTVLAKKIENIKKKSKKFKKMKKIKNARNNFWGPCQVLNMYIYQLQNRKGCRADPLSEVTRKRLKKSPQINCIILYNTVCII